MSVYQGLSQISDSSPSPGISFSSDETVKMDTTKVITSRQLIKMAVDFNKVVRTPETNSCFAKRAFVRHTSTEIRRN